jgi:beta-glucosidase
MADSADVAILAIGDNEGTCREGWWFDHLGDRDSLDLLGSQVELIERVAATGTPIVAVVMGGRPLDLSPVLDHARAILQAWYPGQEGGEALAEILAGEVSPSAKLPVTFPRSVGQIPRYAARKPSDGRGYLFTSHEPLFAFGHGLSYTTFEYGDLRVEPSLIAPDGQAEVTLRVRNTGTRHGTEVVQLYVHDRVASVTRPVRALRGFERVPVGPGEERLVRFSLTPSDLSLLNRKMQRIVEPGVFDIYVGGSSDAELSVELTVSREVTTVRPPTESR